MINKRALGLAWRRLSADWRQFMKQMYSKLVSAVVSQCDRNNLFILVEPAPVPEVLSVVLKLTQAQSEATPNSNRLLCWLFVCI